MSDDAIERYEKMLADDPQSRAFAPLAEAHRKAGRLDDAINVAKAGLEIHTGYSGGLVVLGRALFEKGEIDKAAEILQQAISDTPESYLGQKFLGKVLMEKGENKGALRALEAANLLSPEDEEVARLLDEVRSKASPPETMIYSEKDALADQKAQIVTYEQKPTTVDGIELPPLPASAIEDTFSFSGGGTVDPADITPIPLDEEEVYSGPGESEASASEIAGDDMSVTVVDEEEVEQAMDIQTLDELGPEAAAFIQEGESLLDNTVDNPTDEAVIEVEGEEFVIITEDPAEIPSPLPDTSVIQNAAGAPGLEAEPMLQQSVPEISTDAEASSVASEAIVDEMVGKDVLSAEMLPEPLPEPVLEPVPAPPREAAPEYTPEPPPEPPPEPSSVSAPQADPEVLVRPPVVEAAPVPIPMVENEAAPGPEPVAPSLPVSEPSFEDVKNDIAQDMPVPTQLLEQPAAPILPDVPSQVTDREEQFSTETLADLYAQQGLIEKAAHIYRQILDQSPANETVRLKLDALSEQVSTGTGSDYETQPPSEDQVVSAAEDNNASTLRVLEGLLGNVERMKRT